LAVAALLCGCGRNDIQVYRVAKQSAPSLSAEAQSGGLPAGHPDIGSSAALPARANDTPNLTWTLPAGWEQVPPGEMRVASFRIKAEAGKQADVGIFPLPGMAGRDIDNVNRWRGQVGLEPISEEAMAKAAEPVEITGQKAQLFDVAGQNPSSAEKTRILAAILRRDDVSWFFKMNGDDALVAQQKPAFVQFLKSLQFSAPVAQAQLPPSHPPIDAAAAAPQPATSSGDNPDKPKWQTPAGWTEVNGGQFLVAKFTIAGTTPTSVNVSMSPGEGGGMALNVNRWRGQLGLPQASEADLGKLVTQVDTGGGKAMFVDMTGTEPRTGQKTRLVGAIVPQANRTWFYKLMGNEQVVDQQKDAFVKFVQTAQYPQ
jgi:hypothetical protein